MDERYEWIGSRENVLEIPKQLRAMNHSQQGNEAVEASEASREGDFIWFHQWKMMENHGVLFNLPSGND